MACCIWQTKQSTNCIYDMAIPSNDGCSKSLIYIQDQIEVPRKKQIRMHELRHTFASYLLA